jgi:Glycogen debranching enzyme N terminal
MALVPDRLAEWLEAGGLGGLPSGTVAGPRTRRYHALLLVATMPPTGRFVLVNGLDAWVDTEAGRIGQPQDIAPAVVFWPPPIPAGLRVKSFHLRGLR